MSKKRRVRAPQPGSRWRAWLSGNALWIGVVVVLVAAVAGAVWLATPRQSTSATLPSADKTKGSANAAVTVIEYGDFQ